ncbi:unnamed protein product [Arabis nemorensis]|uniref:DUF223 domain-containing protein n=1 Tax=Arabis nemorensis TaxID=586526 RepID=A0A565CRI4_9BRAS|nr:unnamed protein product [Arabis nemorensis]
MLKQYDRSLYYCDSRCKMKFDFTPIAQLNPVSENEIWKIKARVFRIWRFQNNDKPRDIGGLDLILVDDKNCEQIPNHSLRFNFIPFEELFSRSHDETVFLDVIGEIIEVHGLKEINVCNAPLVEQLIVFFGKRTLKTYMRKMTIQSANSPTKLFINYDIREINEFKEKMPKDVISTSPSSSTLTLSNSEPDHYSLDSRRTIFQLLTSDEEVIQLINKSAYELLEQQVQFNRMSELPPELQALENRQFVFTVYKPSTTKNFRPTTFKVVKITDDPAKLSMFRGDDVNTADIAAIGPNFSNFT